MLSEENIEKLNMNGLYTCEPNIKYRGSLFGDNLYHCCNWTFDIVKNPEGKYFMKDTYWSSGGSSLFIPLTDENVDDFDIIFDRNEVTKVASEEARFHEKSYKVGINSGGWSYPKHFVDVNSSRSKRLVLQDIEEKLRELDRNKERLIETKKGIESGKCKLEWY